jgi:hypothetical protein
MTYEEKLIRFISSKLIQKRYFLRKGSFPEEKKLAIYINMVLEDLKSKYRQLKYVRIHSPSGLITPAIMESVNKLKF